MPGSLAGMGPGGMQQRLDLGGAAVSLAQSLSLSRQQEHLMSLAGSPAAAAALTAASQAGGLGGPPPSHNPEKIGMTNVSLSFYFVRKSFQKSLSWNSTKTFILSLLF